MDSESLTKRLSHITTIWSLVYEAHGPDKGTADSAQGMLLERYAGAVHRYLLGATRDAEAADELFQEFAIRFLRGNFRNACPDKGRFRDFLKTALYHLVVDWQKRKKTFHKSLERQTNEPAAPLREAESDLEFMESCREDLMDRTWLKLASLERQTGQPSFTLLRFRADHPLASSAELAEQIGVRLNRTFTVAGVRKALQRAREAFVDLLLDEVSQDLGKRDRANLEDELADLGLLAYCRSALERWDP